jgi:hypothetical protein
MAVGILLNGYADPDAHVPAGRALIYDATSTYSTIGDLMSGDATMRGQRISGAD